MVCVTIDHYLEAEKCGYATKKIMVTQIQINRKLHYQTTTKKTPLYNLEQYNLSSTLPFPFADITRFHQRRRSERERCQRHQATIINSDTHKLHPKFFTFAIFHGNVLKRNSLSFVVLSVESLTPNVMLALIVIKPSLNS